MSGVISLNHAPRPSASSAPAVVPGPLIAGADEPLASMMDQVGHLLRAEGCYLTLDENRSGEPTILFAKSPADAGAEVEAALIVPATGSTEFGSGPHRARSPAWTTRDAVPVAAWTDVSTEGQSWSMLRIRLGNEGRGELALVALFKGTGATLRRAAERAAKRACPVLSPFMRLWTARAMLRQKVEGLSCALDHSDVGVVLLDRDACILFANRAAQGLLDDGSGIRRKGRSVTATALADAVRLQVAIEHVTTAPADRERTIRFPLVTLRRSTGRALMASVLPPRRTARGGGDAAAVLYLIDPDEDIRPLLKPPCRLYGLSPVETKLACHLANGASVDDAALAMRIKPQTARTYLKQIFIKTDTRRQADLVRVLLLSVVRTLGGGEAEIV